MAASTIENSKRVTLSPCNSPQPRSGPQLDRKSSRQVEEGHYLIRKIAEGGDATIYIARPIDTPEHRWKEDEFILKVFHRGEVVRFMHERQVIPIMGAQNIAPPQFGAHLVCDEESNTDFALSMAQHGVSLVEYLQRNKALPLQKKLSIVMQVIFLGEKIFTHGKIHRDLKPENVLVEENSTREPVVKIIDFSFYTNIGEITPGFSPNARVGTPGYIGPISLTEHNADPRQDVFATACIAYYILSGGIDAFPAVTEAGETIDNPYNAAPSDLSSLLNNSVMGVVESHDTIAMKHLLPHIMKGLERGREAHLFGDLKAFRAAILGGLSFGGS